ncbi:hypothetical protein APR04_005748 [Promicromonospora umidemergens]|nr:hypothetical protein [Promicromonospora umidemergens]
MTLTTVTSARDEGPAWWLTRGSRLPTSLKSSAPHAVASPSGAHHTQQHPALATAPAPAPIEG